MSDYHVLDGDDDGATYRVVFHIPIPISEQNLAGEKIRDCIAQDDSVNKVSIVPAIHLGAGEDSDLLAGVIYEHVIAARKKPSAGLPPFRTRMDDRFASLSVSVLARLNEEYKFWGFNRNVP